MNWLDELKLDANPPPLEFCTRTTRHLGLEMEEEIIISSRKLPIQFIAMAAEFLKEADRWAAGKFIVAVKCNTREEISAVEKKIAQLK